MIGVMGINALIGFGLLALLVVGIAAGFRWLTGSAGRRVPGLRTESALDLLRERYARGEIDGSEFQRRARISPRVAPGGLRHIGGEMTTVKSHVGSPAVGFALQDTAGAVYRLEQYRGHWLLMVFLRHLA